MCTIQFGDIYIGGSVRRSRKGTKKLYGNCKISSAKIKILEGGSGESEGTK